MKLTSEQLNKVYGIIEANESLKQMIERKMKNLEPVYSILCEIARDYGIA